MVFKQQKVNLIYEKPDQIFHAHLKIPRNWMDDKTFRLKFVNFIDEVLIPIIDLLEKVKKKNVFELSCSQTKNKNQFVNQALKLDYNLLITNIA